MTIPPWKLPWQTVRHYRTVGDTRKDLQEELFPELLPAGTHVEVHTISKNIMAGWDQKERFRKDDLQEK